MLDPLFLQHLTHGRVTGELMNQLARLYPEIPIEASLPLLAARLMGPPRRMMTTRRTRTSSWPAPDGA